MHWESGRLLVQLPQMPPDGVASSVMRDLAILVLSKSPIPNGLICWATFKLFLNTLPFNLSHHINKLLSPCQHEPPVSILYQELRHVTCTEWLVARFTKNHKTCQKTLNLVAISPEIRVLTHTISSVTSRKVQTSYPTMAWCHQKKPWHLSISWVFWTWQYQLPFSHSWCILGLTSTAQVSYRKVMQHDATIKGFTEISPFQLVASFSANLGFIRKSPRSRASSFSWHTLVFSAVFAWEVDGFLHEFHGVPTQQCAKTISFSVRVPVLSEKTKLTCCIRSRAPGIGSMHFFAARPVPSPLPSQQSLPWRPILSWNIRFQIDMSRNPMGQNMGGFDVLSSFIWGSLLIWNPKTSFTWIRKQNLDGWLRKV